MNALRRKLNSTRGASMLIALIYFLAAIAVGTVVLVAASSDAGRVAHNMDDQREFFAVESAVALVKDDFKNARFTAYCSEGYTETVVEDKDENDEVIGQHKEISDEYETADPNDASVSGSSILAKKVGDLASLWLETASVCSESTLRDLDDELSFTADVDDLPAVIGSITIDEDTWDITVALETESGSNAVTLFFGAAVRTFRKDSSSTTGADTFYDTTYTTTVKWADPIITKGVA